MSGTNNNLSDFTPPPPGEILGHPKALWNLFGAEFWERFCYYGMRALLAVYVATAFFSHLPEGEANAQASLTYGAFTALVYATGIFGGFIADRYLGYQRSIMVGGGVMAVGMFMLLSPQLHWFVVGLAVMAVGNGLFKPNISTMVGKLYEPGDARRDSGFTIFYMGINAGAFIAPLVCGGLIGATFGYKWGFFTAGLGMILGLMVFQVVKSWLGHIGEPPAGAEGYDRIIKVILGCALAVPVVYFLLSKTDIAGFVLVSLFLALVVYFNAGMASAVSLLVVALVVGVVKFYVGKDFEFTYYVDAKNEQWKASVSYTLIAGLAFVLTVFGFILSKDKVQRDRYLAMVILFFANMFFWALFEQAGSSLNFLARDFVDSPFNFTVFQSFNPAFILLFAPLFAMLWPALDKKGINPSIPRKFSFALIGVGLGFYILIYAIDGVQASGGKISWLALAACYLIHTLAELCLSPIGLSMVTKLASPKEVGMAMGGWFLSIAMANFVAGAIAAIASGGGGEGETVSNLAQYSETFMLLVKLGVGAGLVYLIFAPLINKLMHGVK
jgi:proton-dependent oligopeptide transporter, POT family